MARLKTYHVTLKATGPYSSWAGNAVLPTDPPKGLHGNYTKTGRSGSNWMRRISTEVYLDGDVEDVIKLIRRAADGLHNAVVNIDTRQVPYEDYETPYNTISGIREATPEEVVWIERQIKLDEEAEVKRKADEVENLRKRLAELEGS